MLVSPLPVIEISLAPPEEPHPEPYSPFTPTMKASFASDLRIHDPSDDDEGIEPYRPALLSPPPPVGARPWAPAPIRKVVPSSKGSGLAESEFQALLRAARERPSNKKQDLRREVAIKAHRSKQVERRALFLSKIGAPPSPTAVGLPKTPPDSPAEFHYSLPSPGLTSPLALFGSLATDEVSRAQRTIRVERVDFRAEAAAAAGKSTSTESKSTSIAIEPPIITLSPAPTRRARPGHLRKRSVPSLEQITERYAHGSQAAAPPVQEAPVTPASSRLPAFLAARRQTPSPPPQVVAEVPVVSKKEDTSAVSRPRLARTGRIPTPPRSQPATTCSTPTPAPAPVIRKQDESDTQPLPQPPSPCPRLRSRTSTARDMLCAVRRRTVLYGYGCGYPAAPLSPCSANFVGGAPERLVSSLSANPKRNSAPAELGIRRSRSGFVHPVLSMPGGF